MDKILDYADFISTYQHRNFDRERKLQQIPQNGGNCEKPSLNINECCDGDNYRMPDDKQVRREYKSYLSNMRKHTPTWNIQKWHRWLISAWKYIYMNLLLCNVIDRLRTKLYCDTSSLYIFDEYVSDVENLCVSIIYKHNNPKYTENNATGDTPALICYFDVLNEITRILKINGLPYKYYEIKCFINVIYMLDTHMHTHTRVCKNNVDIRNNVCDILRGVIIQLDNYNGNKGAKMIHQLSIIDGTKN